MSAIPLARLERWAEKKEKILWKQSHEYKKESNIQWTMKNFNSIYSNEENESHELNFKAEKSCTEKRCEVISINVEVNDNDTKRKCRTSTAYRIKPVISSFAHFIRIICFVFRFFFHLSLATASRHQFIFVAFFVYLQIMSNSFR